ncbi:MAG TPA: DUF1330 domain-containing protein [Frankiaceae bacterium]|jgi:uncharacterized protein (DUF1330 family)|nr:DUF1330 domain-containing protein [Frankiaceae bacterium]
MTAICMLNALWFRPDGGAERYAEYGAAVGPILDDVGAKLLFPPFPLEQALEGGFDPDLVVFVRYPSWEAFDGMWRTQAYQEIAHLRTEAISKAVLTRCAIDPDDATPVEQLGSGIVVLNALTFVDGGAAIYDEYLRQAEPLVRARGGQFLSPRMLPQAALGEEFLPDLVFLGQYPSIEAVQDMVGSTEYQQIAPTRSRSLKSAVTTVLRSGAGFRP